MFDKYQTKGAYHFDWLVDPKFAWYKACIDKCVEFCETTSVLDLGCGEGVIGSQLFEKVDFDEDKLDYVGIDKEHSAVELADPALDVRQGDIENDYFAGKWDYMVCLNTIEHLENPEAIKRIFNRSIIKAAIIITDMPNSSNTSAGVQLRFTMTSASTLKKSVVAFL